MILSNLLALYLVGCLVQVIILLWMSEVAPEEKSTALSDTIFILGSWLWTAVILYFFFTKPWEDDE